MPRPLGLIPCAEMEAADWPSLNDAELLERRISIARIAAGGHAAGTTHPATCTTNFSQKGLTFHPPCHIGDEWFVPVGIPAIFVPFFLVHERLRKLERKMILEVEGETPEWFLRLMRHETAHAYMPMLISLPGRKNGSRCFGLTSTEETPQFYRPRPYSPIYAVHLDHWYAQSHPDGDFAETFAVWLTPGLDWRWSDSKAGKAVVINSNTSMN